MIESNTLTPHRESRAGFHTVWIVFDVSISNCTNSDGRFDFDIFIKNESDPAFEDRIGRAETWGRTHDSDQVTVEYIYDKIRDLEYIDRIEITNVSCTCHDN